ncbi:MAG TPA: GAF domain-containing protein [Bryobacteraceae bacterium]|jgi:adenylate cyclase|nr:GAF domain-containing protein [Bryobacteraceae bacterium]
MASSLHTAAIALPPAAAFTGPKPPAEEPQMRHLELLLRVAKEVAAHDTLEEMLRNIVSVSAEETGAERGTLFLNDDRTGELYSRFAQGTALREIRILNNIGVAGNVFTTGVGAIVHDPYNDPRFNSKVDQETGFITKSILCAPIRTVKGELIGVLQMLNKKQGQFTETHLRLLEDMTSLTAMALRSRQFVERMHAAREQEMRFLDVVADVTSDIDLGTMLLKVVTEAARMLEADRATLFLNDEKTNELFSRVAMGASVGEIRMPNHLGIAGAVFTSGKTINIPYAYADLRFNPAFDKRTGYFTRSILCVPIVNKAGKTIGVTQVLNRRGGPFTSDDEARLKAFTAQLAISLESARLFDQVQQVKNYNESMLQSMTNGVITLNDTGSVVTCNAAGLRILRTTPAEILNRKSDEYFTGPNTWVLDRIKVVEQTLQNDSVIDAQFVAGAETVSVNLTSQPLMSTDDKGAARKIGTLLMFEDVSSEKRMKSTMSRYMDPRLADQLMAGGEEVLGGKSATVTVLFSDVRNFTGITEELGAHGTVKLLNEYFTIMVECIQKRGGMLDKFIGDAIMAAFGLPLPHGDDEDRAVQTTISMIEELRAWNAERIGNGKKPVDIGIGLNTDNVVSGNIGSPRRMDYTIIGDGVNLASRLESACKQYSARVLISEMTYKRLKGTYRVREVDRVVVKGKTEAVGVYEVLDYHTPESFPNLSDVLQCYREGLDQYRRQEWDKALSSLGEGLKMNPNDKLSQMYVERAQWMKANPPGNDWNGIWVLKSK